MSGGHVVDVTMRAQADGLSVTTEPPAGALGQLVGAGGAFAAMNLAFSPGSVVIDVASHARIDGPVVLLVDCPAGASFPRVLVRVGEGGSVRVLEHLTGPQSNFVAGVAEYVVGDGASLDVASVQSLGPTCWTITTARSETGHTPRPDVTAPEARASP